MTSECCFSWFVSDIHLIFLEDYEEGLQKINRTTVIPCGLCGITLKIFKYEVRNIIFHSQNRGAI